MIAGYELYKRIKKDKKVVNIYILESIHAINGKSDSISLAEAGKRYLKDWVDEKDILDEKISEKSERDDGDYTATDECYVASKLYMDQQFDELYCVCSSSQAMKNWLFFLENEIIANIISVPPNMDFHNPYYEATMITSKVLHGHRDE